MTVLLGLLCSIPKSLVVLKRYPSKCRGINSSHGHRLAA